MSVRKTHTQHAGERRVQRLRGSDPDQPERLQQWLEGSHEMPAQHASFFTSLPYFPFGALDAQGRPWATLLVSPRTSVLASDSLRVTASIPLDDPFALALASTSASPPHARLFAGVGVDFSNRRRNKLNGWVHRAGLSESSPSSLELELVTTENMGNCPKYITVQNLVPCARKTQPAVSLGCTLDADARALLDACSTAFLASRHLDAENEVDSDMGFNHRGGPPGFIRYYKEGGLGHLVIPDYSGNQLFQSLGNLETDPLAGLVCLDFRSGDALHLTGAAQTLFGAAAEALMPRCSTVTDIRIDSAVLIKQSLQLELVGAESFSPYNPPLRLLSRELAASGRPLVQSGEESTATLLSITRECSSISSFTFQLPAPAGVPPAGYAIFDFSRILRREYQHMNQAAPKLVNDDFVRTWTVSDRSADGTRLTVTVKRVEKGTISSLLHSIPTSMQGVRLQVGFRGYGGGMSCTAPDGSLPPQLWLAAGVGITPFLALLRHLRSEPGRVFSATLLFSCRGDEALLSREFAADARVRVLLFDSTAAAGAEYAGLAVTPRRIAAADVAEAAAAGGGGLMALLCGPAGYQAGAREWLQQAGVPPTSIRAESFNF